jgi:hypothetical protein
MLKRAKRPNPKRAKPRRGSVKDPAYREWILAQPCIVTGRLDVTGHHVRRFGSLKDDRRMVPLVAELHMLTHEVTKHAPCVERGKAVFEQHWKVDLEAEIERLRAKYLNTK